MRTFFLTLLFCLSLFAASSQTKTKGAAHFQIGCGAAGVTSPVIEEIRKLVRSKNYIFLERRLYSDDLATRILGAIALKQLQQQRLITLTNEEQGQMQAIATGNGTFSVCYACTESFEGSVKQLFKAPSAPAYSLIKFALFELK